VKIKLDENLSRHLKSRLNGLSHEISTTDDEGLLSKPDTLVASVCKSEGKMLLTLDREFGDLRKYPPGTHPGIILFRLSRNGLLTASQFVERFVRETDLKNFVGCNVVVDDNKVRVRRPPPPAGEEGPSGIHEANESPAVYGARRKAMGKALGKKRKKK